MSEYQRFLQDKGELKRYDYDLDKDSIVWDVGGYKGDFADNIFKKFGCHVIIFEPVFYKDLEIRFSGNEYIFVNPYGLSNVAESKMIAVNADSTSLHKLNDFNFQVFASFKDINEIMYPTLILDLIKINIEGEEYNLLERMIETGIVSQFRNIQVQFHNFVKNAEKRKEAIQKKLKKTHDCEWSYDFIWESWRLK